VPARDRQAESDLKSRFLREGYRFDFYQLLHLLETWQGREVALGRAGPLHRERIRLRPDSSLTFSPADVRQVEEAGDEERRRGESWKYRVTVNFLGMYGVSSPAPVYFSELIGFTDVDAEPLVDFLDLFNHRILSFFYRAGVKYRYPYRFEPGGKDEFSSYALSFIGLRDEEVQRLAALPAVRLIKYLGLLGMRTRPPVGLRLLVSDYLGGVPVEVEEWVLRWVRVPPESLNRLGLANSRLGLDLTLGERVPDRSGKFRVRLGPLRFREYLDYLPDRTDFATLCSLTRLWSQGRMDFDAELVVRGPEVPVLRLSSEGLARLGWTSWLTSRPGLERDASVVYAPRPVPSPAPPEGGLP